MSKGESDDVVERVTGRLGDVIFGMLKELNDAGMSRPEATVAVGRELLRYGSVMIAAAGKCEFSEIKEALLWLESELCID